MKWEKPVLHDLSDLKNSVAQGACSIGINFTAGACDGGLSADDCPNGTAAGIDVCSLGSADNP